MTACLVQAQDQSLADLIGNTDVYKVEVLPAKEINTRALEFSPEYYRDGIVFVSSRPRSGGLKDKSIDEAFFDLYYAPFDKDGWPVQPVPFSAAVNSAYHEGPVSISASGDLLFFTRNNLRDGARTKGKDIQNVQKIFEARRGPEDWIQIRELPFNSDSFSVLHPALSADGTRLFFASDMPGGYGGMDLYMVERIGSEWSAPINLGPDVNTTRNEAFPFVHVNGDLYFASNGHKGLGGYDIFLTRQGGKKWNKPVHLGEPLNSREDDLGLVLAPHGHEGFFTSNRLGGRRKDEIFRIRIQLRDDLPYVQTQLVAIDKESRQRLSDIEVRIYETTPEGGLMPSCPFYSYVDAETGEIRYQVKERVATGKPDLLTDVNGVATAQLYKRKNYLLVVEKSGYKRFFMPVTTPQGELRLFLEQDKTQPCVQVEGQVLAADKSMGLEQAEIRIRTAGRQDVRTYKSASRGAFSLCLDAGVTYEVEISRAGYQTVRQTWPVPAEGNSRMTGQKISLQPQESIISESGLQEGVTLILNNIYYDYNKADIRSDATRELDELIAIMKRYPSMEIELIAHTDSRGDWMYNQKLSLQRANAAKSFLSSKGIAPSRVRALGYGESQVRNHCLDGVECSEEEHQYNRRTEVRILRMKENVKIEYGESGNQHQKSPAGN